VLEYIIKTIIDSDYYFQKMEIMALNEIVKYYKNYLLDSKKNDIKEIEDIIAKKKNFNDNFLKDYQIAREENKKDDLLNKQN
jgi:hypothetical protein